jgi:cell division septation protein DedD
VTSNRQQARPGLSVPTLMIASLSSLAAALVVSKIWGGGTLFGAAMTPVIVALVSEGLRRPATIVTSVRETRSTRYDPVAEGRAGLREGDLDRARSTMPAAAVAERRVHRVSGGGGSGLSLRLPRPRVIAAVVTGLVAFALAGLFLTGSELVLGKSVVSSSKRTTFVPVHRSTSTGTTTTKTTDTTPSTTTTTPTTSTPTSSAPAATTTTPTAPPTQTAPPATATPAPQAAPPATPTTPAPQSATPPASTTP